MACVLCVLNFALNIPHSSIWYRLPCSSTLISAKAVQKWFTFLGNFPLCCCTKEGRGIHFPLQVPMPETNELKTKIFFASSLSLFSLLECNKRNCICANKQCIAITLSQFKAFSQSAFFPPREDLQDYSGVLETPPEFLYVDYSNGFHIDQRKF